MSKTLVSTALTAALLGALAFSTAATATDLAPQSMALTANVSNACSLSVDDFSAGNEGIPGIPMFSASFAASGNSWIYVKCNQDTAYAVSMGAGENFGLAPQSPTLRAMTDGAGHFVPYELFIDPVTEVPFNGANLTGVGNGVVQNIPIGVAFYDFNRVPQGTYVDHVDVTLSFN